MTPNNSQVMLSFVAACQARDVERALSHFTDESVFHNIPAEPARGMAGIRSLLEAFFSSCSGIRFDIHSMAESDPGIVLSERTDCFLVNGLWLKIRVMGAVEVGNGKILAWREYYDSRQMDAEFAKGASAASVQKDRPADPE